LHCPSISVHFGFADRDNQGIMVMLQPSRKN